MIVSPSLHSTLEEISITCCAPEVIISSSYSFVMEYLSSKYFLSVFLKGIYPSVILYCNAQVGSSLKISFTIFAANYAQTECQFRYCGTAIPFLTVRSTAR